MSMSPRVRLVVVMDPIAAIRPAKDSTLAILVAAQARGWQLFYAEQKDLWLRDGVAWGRLAPLQVFDDLERWFVLGAAQSAKLGEFDVILMRKDPPFDTEYIYTTYILDRAEAQGALVCNRPQGLRDMNEKVYTAWFPECCAPTLITRDMHDMSEFLREQGKAIVISSHILADMEEYCTHIGVMAQGSMVQLGTVAEVSSHGGGNGRCRYTAIVVGSSAALASVLKEIDGVTDMQCDRDRITFEFSSSREESAALLSTLVGRRAQVASFMPHAAGLEEAYLRIGIKQVD